MTELTQPEPRRLVLWARRGSVAAMADRLRDVDGLSLEVAADEAQFRALVATADAAMVPGHFWTPSLAQHLRDAAPRLQWLQVLSAGMRVIGVRRHAVPDPLAHESGAALDVTTPEPLPRDHPLRSAPNLIVTPHVAGAGSGASVARFVAENARRFAAGERLAGEVDVHRAA